MNETGRILPVIGDSRMDEASSTIVSTSGHQRDDAVGNKLKSHRTHHTNNSTQQGKSMPLGKRIPTPKYGIIANTDAFVLAAIRGDIEHVKADIANNQNINGLHSSLGYTALHGASLGGKMEVIKYLLDHGAKRNIRRSGTDETPLHFAAKGRIKHAHSVAQMLLNNGARKAELNVNGWKATHVATDCGRDALALELCQNPEPPTNLQCVDVSSHYFTVEFNIPETFGCRLLGREVRWRFNADRGRDTPRVDVAESLQWGAIRSRPWERKVTEEECRWDYNQQPLTSGHSTHQHHDHPHTTQPHSNNDDGSYPFHIPSSDDTILPGGPNGRIAITSLTLWPATVYEVEVRVKSVAGWGEWSDPILVTTKTYSPDQPTNVRPLGTSALTISATWDAPERDNGHHILHYNVQVLCVQPSFKTIHSEGYDPTQTQEWKTISSSVMNTFLICRGLKPDTGYRIRVKASTVEGNGPWSETSPVIKTNPELNAIDVKPRSILLSWAGGGGVAICYEVEMMKAKRSGSGERWDGCEWRTIVSNAKGETYDVTRLDPDNSYRFRVRGFLDRVGWTSWEDAGVSDTVRTKSCEPGAVQEIRGANILHNSVDLTWVFPISNGAYIDRFRIQRRVSPVAILNWAGTLLRFNGGSVSIFISSLNIYYVFIIL